MYCTYVEEADDDANKVSQRKRIGIKDEMQLLAIPEFTGKARG